MPEWNESDTTFGEVKSAIGQFLEERGWESRHSPKNLAMSIAIEAAELMEIFQWVSSDEAAALADNPATFQHIQEEVADVIIYSISLARTLDFDLAAALQDKIQKNNMRFPVPAKSATKLK